MISRLSAKNCYSFFDEILVDFRVNNKAPTSAKYHQSLFEDSRLTKVLAAIGPNASGKSNLLRVIHFVQWFIIESFGKSPEEGFPLEPFRLKKPPFDAAEIEIEFEFNRTSYRYKVRLNDLVRFESLDFIDFRETKDRRRYKNLFTREWNVEKKEYSIQSTGEYALSAGIVDIVRKRKNASLISAAIYSNHEKSLPLKKYWSNVHTNIKQFGSRLLPLDLQILESSKFYYGNENYLKTAENILSQCDLGLASLRIEKWNIPKEVKVSGKAEDIYVPVASHNGVDGVSVELPFPNESSGTQKIFNLLASLLPVLNTGGVAVIDELEADLHPNLLPSILDLFQSNDNNPHAAQLIFTCHATPLLNVLDKYQILIVQKNPEGVSDAWRVDEIEGVRNDDNFFAKYTSGAYGGIPEIGYFKDVAK